MDIYIFLNKGLRRRDFIKKGKQWITHELTRNTAQQIDITLVTSVLSILKRKWIRKELSNAGLIQL